MTNSIAIALGLLILAMFAADDLWLHLDLPVLAARTMDGLINHVSFWH